MMGREPIGEATYGETEHQWENARREGGSRHAAALGDPRDRRPDRNEIRLGIAQCGACSVHINGEVMRSCSIRLGDVKASDKIVTIEGLSPNSSHPVQRAWASVDVPQCGYCQSGQIMAAAALLKKNPKPSDADIDAAMTNICRCGTYQRIREAVHVAADGASTIGKRSANRATSRS